MPIGRTFGLALGLASGLAVVVLGCATQRTGAPAPTTPGLDRASASDLFAAQELLPADALAEDLVLRQRVTIQWDGREERFEAVLQKRGTSLLLLGLGPMNSVGFRLALEDRNVVFENRTDREMPFVPERILLDVQRVFYPWIEDEPACLRCDRHAIRDGIEIVERLGAKHLEERRFAIEGRLGRDDIIVRYETWIDDPRVPSRVVLRNAPHGYDLLIETTSAERIE